MVENLGKERKSWGRLSWVLGWEGADPKVSGNFYKAVAQAVLLFGEETWVLTQRMEKALDRFQSRVARRLTGKQPWRRTDGGLGLPASDGGTGGSGARGDKEAGTKEA